MLSYTMVQIATRGMCILGVRKNAIGASVLCLSAGLPDLLTSAILVRRPGMQAMAVSNPFGAFAFNALVALGLPWAILGKYADVFPPAHSTWFASLTGFIVIMLGLAAIVAWEFKVTRRLGLVLMALYASYLILIIHDGATRPARPPAR